MKKLIKNFLKVIAVCGVVCGISMSPSETAVVYAQVASKAMSIETVLAQSYMTTTQRNFIRSIYPYVKSAYETEGVLQSVVLAQAIIESNWGKSDLGSAPHHNLFGIKASADWKGKTYEKETREYVNGQVSLVKQSFRSYDSYEEGILDYSKFFTSTSWRAKNYEKFLKSKNYVDAANALQQAGYASDPNYAKSLQNAIETYKLNLLDDEQPVTVKDKNPEIIINLDIANLTVPLTISDAIQKQDIKSVKIAVWSDKDGQDDIVWYTAEKNDTNDYEMSTSLLKHSLASDKFHFHVYYELKNGQMFKAETREQYLTLPPIAKTTQKLVDASLLLQVDPRLVRTGTVLIAVWSDANGQDDLRWYQVDSSAELKVPFSNHNGYGKYHIHIYQHASGKMNQLEAQEFHLDKPTATTTIERKTSTTFEVTLTNVPSYMDKVLVPTWSDVNGQDDIIWYEARKVATGQYKLLIDTKNHQFNTGQYHVHLYGISRLENGRPIHLGNTQGFVISNTSSHLGNMQLGALNETSGLFPIQITNVMHQSGIKSVKVAIWSDKGGQDDIVWYTAGENASNNYDVTASLFKHSLTSDKFHFHMYYELSNGQMFKAETKEQYIVLPPIAKTTQKLVDASLLLQVDPRLVRTGTVLIAVWSDVNGQDDLRWYQVDSSAELKVPFSNHNGYGKYHIHIYQHASGKMNQLEAQEFHLDKPTATTAIERKTSTTFEVTLTNVPSYMDKVLVPTWSDVNGQDDIIWYEARKVATGQYKLLIDTKNHQFNTGQYHVHLYGISRLENGRVVHLGNTQGFVAEKEKPNFSGTGIFENNGILYYFINGKIATHYTGYYLENNMAYDIKQGVVHKKATTDISKVVFIDPGHGGIDNGAAYYGLKEKDLVLDVSKKLRLSLQEQGYTVVLSREDDKYIDFKTERSRMVNETNSDIFISIHFNASGKGEGSSVHGVETYWYEYDANYQPKINQDMHNDPIRLQRSEWLAKAIHQGVLQESGAADRRVKRDTFAVLRETTKPAALIELGFMDNYDESQKIRLESYRQRLVDGLLNGITKYYNDLIATYFNK